MIEVEDIIQLSEPIIGLENYMMHFGKPVNIIAEIEIDEPMLEKYSCIIYFYILQIIKSL